MACLFYLAVLLGSFLLFSVQPMIAKVLLPQVGGAPGIWVTAMLFFQCMLLFGYGYAALSSAYLASRWQSACHVILMIAAIIFVLPISLEEGFELELNKLDQGVVTVLFTTIGLPYLLLSTLSSLMQRWYSSLTQDSPYFLFSISNIGALLGLMSYPLLFEWLLPLQEQMTHWSIAFYGLLVLMIIISIFLQKVRNPHIREQESLGKALPAGQVLRLVFYGFVPSSLFLSTTLFMTTDMASMPLLWVVPLALYLLSFILVFSRYGERWVVVSQALHVPVCALVFLLACYVFAFVSHIYANNHYVLQIVLHLACLFVVAVSFHGQAYRQKPSSEYLTSYYFWLAVGGALGGVFNTIAPHLFNDIYEYPIVLLVSLSVPILHWLHGRQSFSKIRSYVTLAGVGAIALSVLVMGIESQDYPPQYKKRNFFGVKKVTDLGYSHFRRDFRIGSTLQGYQPTFPGYQVYLNHNLKQLIERAPEGFFEKPFAVIGLGTGMFACIAQEGQAIDLYEMDPLVVEVASNPEFFTYLRDCKGKPNMVLGDGRLNIAKQPSEHYKLIVLDAFNSNAIPMHLLTVEAIESYLGKLDKAQGVLAFNIINRHVDLKGVLGRAAQQHELLAYHKLFEYDPEHPYDAVAEWVFMIPENSPWRAVFEDLRFAQVVAERQENPLWTDDHSSIVRVLK